ncbi:hypothetical protein Taro_041462 [Colocasia esculenta]|uniref:Uncharacterized protein n=1 Tax=Colocasia esculenta TaxID=4460 RepID=A0A843WVY9_COLES|nr:hypothetical protein [Colocasia esculenta]
MVSRFPSLHGGYSLAVSSSVGLVLSGCLVQAPNYCFSNLFLGVVRGGTGVVSEVQGGSACGPSTLWRSEVVVPVVRHYFSRGFLVSLVVTPGCSFPTLWRSRMLVLCRETLVSLGRSGVPRAPLSRRVCAKVCFRIVFDSTGSAGVMFGLIRVVVEAFLCFHCFVVLCVGGSTTFGGPWRGSGRSSRYKKGVSNTVALGRDLQEDALSVSDGQEAIKE